MATIQRSALVQYTAEQMFDLVNDIASYPEFMIGCDSAVVLEEDDDHLIGKLSLSRGGMSQTFTTHNSLLRPETINMRMVEGNFSKFSARWVFLPLSDTASKMSLHMTFEFRAGLVDMALEKLFSSSANDLVAQVVERAKLVYR
ncbi:MAG TPA: ubiquinone-binding protein [Gammaproteobacteria bacterium]|nr:ubiquinone-binding protein [Gammaproteobacteria bacterium]